MNEILLSVIVPVYNIEQYISKTLDSIFNQTYLNIEVIAVNDGSSDNSGKILDDYSKKEKRLSVIHKENGGVSSARLCGIKAAKGDYIGFVDGDDTVEPDMFEVLINNALKYNADISHCGYNMVFPSRIDQYHGSGKIIEQDNITGLKDLLSGNSVEPTLNDKIFKKNLFVNILSCKTLFLEKIKINEDLLMNFYLFKESKKSIFEDICKYNYVLRPSSAATSSIKPYKLTDPIKVGEILVHETVYDNELSLFANRLYSVRLISAATMSVNNYSDEIKSIRKDARKKLRRFANVYCLNKNESFAKKCQYCFAAFLPDVYRFIHQMYKKLKGTDKIYEIK